MSTLQNVEKPTPWGCLVVASRFGQPEIQSTLKFVYERKRAGKKEESWTGGGMDGGKRAETFPRATIDAPRREGRKMAGGECGFENVQTISPAQACRVRRQ